MNKKYICIHGHFYQPPRENPWLEEVELQDSAYPHHDWNERITQQCYAPNTASRLLDGEGRVVDIVNNYARMSFNFGPTLLSWLERSHPGTYRSVLEADAASRELFSGHGSAIAQCYSHLIMPLANARDQRTQVLWGLADFEHRFSRPPEGMWLPETAVNLETLAALARCEMEFVLLAPGQAKRVRQIGTSTWHDVSGGNVDPRRPYQCLLPDGQSIAVFFYDGAIAREVAFSGMLNDGKRFLERLSGALDPDWDEPQLSHIVTDGESYGHHHVHGDMALAYALHNAQADSSVKLTVYGEFLATHPPTWEAEVWENSSWSCVHGVERWRTDCGCNSGGKPEWNQQWRAPLRGALDWLRDNLASIYENQTKGLLLDPWAARDDYITVLLDRSDASRTAFLQAHCACELSQAMSLKVMSLLEMQRNAMLMYTSCGWFFDEVSGVETVQNLSCAARAIQLAGDASAVELEGPFLDLLERVPSNIPELGNGRKVFELYVKPVALDLLRVGVHYGVSSLFTRDMADGDIFCYSVVKRSLEVLEAGQEKLAVGMVDITSRITTATASIGFFMLYLGGYNLLGAARDDLDETAFAQMSANIKDAFGSSNLADLASLIGQNFHENTYSLFHLFRDEQRRVINQIFGVACEEIASSLRQLYHHHGSILDISSKLGVPLPPAFVEVAQSVLNDEIALALKASPVDAAKLRRATELIAQFDLSVDRSGLGLSLTETLNANADEFLAEPGNPVHLEHIAEILEAVAPLGLELNLWRVQNIFFNAGRPMAAAMTAVSHSGDSAAARWLELFARNSALLNMRFD